MTELQLNIRENICDTLQVFASSERQVVYQKDVPFVHIPREIVAQWDSYCELRDSGWYTEIWNDHELKHLDSFDLKLREVLTSLGQNIADVPEILQNEEWIELMKAAGECLRFLDRKGA